MIMTSSMDTAYLVPKSMWESLQEKLKRYETQDGQTGDAIGGINADGSIDANALLRTMATNLSLTQNPRTDFLQEADLNITAAKTVGKIGFKGGKNVFNQFFRR